MNRRILPLLICAILLSSSLIYTSLAFALDSGSVQIKVTINKGPTIEGLMPLDGYIIIEGDALELSVEASDPNDDLLQYQFAINDIVKRPWSQEPIFSYTLEDTDIGLNRITVEVTDGIETIQTQEIEVYVFRKSLDLPM